MQTNFSVQKVVYFLWVNKFLFSEEWIILFIQYKGYTQENDDKKRNKVR